VGKAVETMRPALPAGVSLLFTPAVPPESGGRPIEAEVSPEQIQQVIINFVRNSLRALETSDNPRKVIRVSVEREGGDRNPEAWISVEDNGPGIRREHLDKLFIPFFTTSPSGTGLGLSISQKIIEAHRGRIEVATEEGRFARFSVVLPALSAHEK
jgi:signal transduction histidine kinase